MAKTKNLNEDVVINTGKEFMNAEEFVNNINHDRNITIKKAKIKDGMFLDVEYHEELPEHGNKHTKLSCTIPVHDDLKEAFHKLHTHLAILCDEAMPEDIPLEIKNIDVLEMSGFDVRSFSIGGSGDSEGVTISGYKEGKYGIVNLNTPFTKFDNENYEFINELSAAIEMCKYEVKEYLFHGKKAPDAQLALAFEDELLDSEIEEA